MDKQEQLKNLFDDTQKVKFGCVMFDLQEDSNGKLIPMPGNGWASIEGGSAYRIKNSGDLSNEVKWLTNLSQDVFWKTGVAKQTKLKYSGYLRTEVGQIMKELGLNPPKVPIITICQTLSELFNKVMRLAIEFYGITSFTQKDLYAEIRQVLFPNDLNISTHVDEALSRAYQDLVICEHPLVKERMNFITLKRPRYFHAKSILDTSVPLWDGDWQFLSPSDLPKTTHEQIEFLMGQERPFVAKVAIHSFSHPDNINVDLSKLLNLGEALGEGGKPKQRNWVCQPELLYLSKFANLEIEAAFVAKGYQELEQKIQLPYLGELSDFSYSLGLLSECVWIGLASRSVNPQTKSKSLVSPRACWLKAADRFMTLTSAMMLSSAGFIVNSYGYGGVTLMVEDERLSQLIEIAPHAGLSVPINIIEKRAFTF
jgi:hypothetical protein